MVMKCDVDWIKELQEKQRKYEIYKHTQVKLVTKFDSFFFWKRARNIIGV